MKKPASSGRSGSRSKSTERGKSTSGRASSSKKTTRAAGPKASAPSAERPVFRPGVESKSKKAFGSKKDRPAKGARPLPSLDGPLRLNRYISNAGVCSRREADSLIESGVVTVNGEIVTQMGMKVHASDIVHVGGTSIRPETKRYVLLNKPKGFGTSIGDANSRRGVMELVQKACKEAIRSIDKLDRESTGLMLFTNDEELMVRLNHPISGAARLYHIVLGEKVAPGHLEELKKGFVVDQGFVRASEAEYANPDRNQIGLKLVSSRSRIARRMMEQLGYHVIKVDRVSIGPLTKKDVPRGTFRHLSVAEINLLRMSS